MIPLLTREQVRALDRAAVERLGVPGVVLMENAGAQATALIRQRFAKQLDRVLILGGVGQNGGDGWVVARHLLCSGRAARCILVGSPEKVAGDALTNLNALRALGIDVQSGLSREQLRDAVDDATLIIDALFGTGLDRPLSEPLQELIQRMNAADAPVVALDLPSGIDADTGQVLGAAPHAALTVTFAAHKQGLHQHPGAQHAGEVVCVGIGVPAPSSRLGLIEACDVAALLPRRAPDAHKGSSGHVLVLAGSAGKTGAAVLCASGAQRAGAGLVTIASDAETQRALDHKVLEIMTAELSRENGLQSALSLAQGKRAAVLGPGFGLDTTSQQLARELALHLPVTTVLDADALTALSGEVSTLQASTAPRVLTPHPGEAARLLSTTSAAIQADRIAVARRLAELSGQVVVLKGARTVIASPEGALRICTRGTPALGTGGTGDVLAGMIAALCVELAPFDAALCGVELHARAGELAARADRGLLASEVAAGVPLALVQCREAAHAAADGTAA